MIIHDAFAKMYLDAAVGERLAEARRTYEVRRTRRLCDLLGALRRVQAELELAERRLPREFAPRGS